MTDRLQQIDNFIKKSIPVTAPTAFQLQSYADGKLTMLCPMQVNANHHGSMFGGSLAMMAIVAGYGLAFSMMEARFGTNWEDEFLLVIQHFEIDYEKPILHDATLTAAIEGDAKEFLTRLDEVGKAAMMVRMVVGDAPRQLSAHANYVIRRRIRK